MRLVQSAADSCPARMQQAPHFRSRMQSQRDTLATESMCHWRKNSRQNSSAARRAPTDQWHCRIFRRRMECSPRARRDRIVASRNRAGTVEATLFPSGTQNQEGRLRQSRRRAAWPTRHCACKNSRPNWSKVDATGWNQQEEWVAMRQRIHKHFFIHPSQRHGHYQHLSLTLSKTWSLQTCLAYSLKDAVTVNISHSLSRRHGNRNHLSFIPSKTRSLTITLIYSLKDSNTTNISRSFPKTRSPYSHLVHPLKRFKTSRHKTTRQ